MTRFEYVAIFYGIVVGLSIENIASSFHKLFDAGKRVRWHWMAPTNAIGSAVATLGQFWVWWLGRDLKVVNPTFLTFLPGAMTAVLLYLVCAATLPDTVPEAGIDLKAYYNSTRRQFWSLALAFVVLSGCVSIWRLARVNFDPQLMELSGPLLLGTLVAAALAASMIVVRAQWWHAIGIITITAATFLMFGSMKL